MIRTIYQLNQGHRWVYRFFVLSFPIPMANGAHQDHQFLAPGNRRINQITLPEKVY